MKFYRNIFAIVCFAFFVTGLTTGSPFAYLVALVCGMFSRTAERKGWPDPF